jgi:hypothetical protein
MLDYEQGKGTGSSSRYEISAANDWRLELLPVSGGYMIKIDGYPVYELGLNIGPVFYMMISNANAKLSKAFVSPFLEPAKRSLVGIVSSESYLPDRAKVAATRVLHAIDAILDSENEDVSQEQKQIVVFSIMQMNIEVGAELRAFDLYWIRPKLALNTTVVLDDATKIFPESIRAALSGRVKYEVQQAANCLLYEAPSAVGFHVLRAIERVVLDYFTVPGFDREDAATWTEYARVLKKHDVHPKIRAMISRLAELHRNELMHAEAVLSVEEEAAILFALMQEVLPIMIADVAKRKGSPIASFPILNDPRWQ